MDAYLRLAYIARNRGDVKRAYEYIEQAKQNQIKSHEEISKPTNQYCLKGKILHDNMDLDAAYAEYAFVLEKNLRNKKFTWKKQWTDTWSLLNSMKLTAMLLWE